MKVPAIGIVAIGRNEGKRLKDCLHSLTLTQCPVVYVDSGSTDGSVELARSLRADVVELDMSIPFSAARARNAGAERLFSSYLGLNYIQFLDGDCILANDWLSQARSFLDTHSGYAVVCGRRRERFRDTSIYNRLIDMEWDTPFGDALACGGDALFRVSAFQQVGGFNPSVIAGEEPELCVRLRQQGWKVMRLDAEMTLHDADMHQFRQWWRRTKRGGFAYALGVAMHGGPPERHWVRETRSAVIWGLVIPIVIIAFALATKGWGGLLLAVYPIQIVRVARSRICHGDSPSDSWLYGIFCVLGKFPELVGILRLWWERWTGQQARIIEYKGKLQRAKR